MSTSNSQTASPAAGQRKRKSDPAQPNEDELKRPRLDNRQDQEDVAMSEVANGGGDEDEDGDAEYDPFGLTTLFWETRKELQVNKERQYLNDEQQYKLNANIADVLMDVARRVPASMPEQPEWRGEWAVDWRVGGLRHVNECALAWMQAFAGIVKDAQLREAGVPYRLWPQLQKLDTSTENSKGTFAVTLADYEFKDQELKERYWELLFFYFDEGVDVAAGRRRAIREELIHGRH